MEVFKDETVKIAPDLQLQHPRPVIARDRVPKQSTHNFEDLRRELVSRKYSYKTVKGYIYYNRDFINHIGKSPFEIKDEDIKDYLVYLSETKGAATSTLN